MKTWWFLWRLFLFKKWTFTLQVGSAIVSMVAVEHAVGLAQREVFDTLTGDAETSLGVWALCAVLVGLAAGHAVAFVGDEMLFRFNRFSFSTLLQGNALGHVLRMDGGVPLPASPGEAVSRFRGDVREAVMPMMDFDLLVGNALFFVIAMAIMVQISAVTAFAVFLPLFAAIVIVHAARGRIRRYRADAREAAGGVTGLIGEMFGMVETVKVSNAEGRIMGEFERVNSERGRTSLKDEVLGQAMEAFSSNAHHIATGALLALLARSMAQGELTVGDLSLFVFYLGNTRSLSRDVGKLLTGYRRVGVSTGRLRELMPGAVRSAVLEHDVDALEDGLDTVVGPRGVRLSGGQRRRAGAARMFAREPELLVLDDVSNGLDAETEQVFWERLSGRRGVTTLVASNRRMVLERAARVILLRDGRVEGQGELGALLATSEETRRLWAGEAGSEDAVT